MVGRMTAPSRQLGGQIETGDAAPLQRWRPCPRFTGDSLFDISTVNRRPTVARE